MATEKDESKTNRAERWQVNLMRLDQFQQERDRLPRENRRQTSPIDEVERSLLNWMRSQRRAFFLGRLTNDQVAQLVQVDGFSFAPLDDQWEMRLKEYEAFTKLRQRAPRLRSEDPHERRLAGWAAKQRYVAKRQRLPWHRVKALSELEYWSWG